MLVRLHDNITVMENIILTMQQLFVVIKMLMLIVDDGHYIHTKVERRDDLYNRLWYYILYFTILGGILRE